LRRLLVNADDFGYTHDVNEGIVAAHRQGILTATTLMANGRAFDHAVEIAKLYPTLDIGCHLVLVGGRSLLDGRDYPHSLRQLIPEIAAGKWKVFDELRAQVEHILAAGLAPTHLDTHKHTHLLPSVLEAVARVGEEFRILWVRRPFDFPLSGGPAPLARQLISRAFGFLRPRFHEVLTRHGCRTTDHFAGFEITGEFRAEDLVRLIESLPEGSTEFMCHPGYCRGELRAAPTRLKESRERELAALTDPRVREALAANDVRLTRYGDL
jgi:predicted glycoside hydrolase/deacetylase ChbG (UPF0249 family)